MESPEEGLSHWPARWRLYSIIKSVEGAWPCITFSVCTHFITVYSKYAFCAERAHVLPGVVAQTLISAAIDGQTFRNCDSINSCRCSTSERCSCRLWHKLCKHVAAASILYRLRQYTRRANSVWYFVNGRRARSPCAFKFLRLSRKSRLKLCRYNSISMRRDSSVMCRSCSGR